MSRPLFFLSGSPIIGGAERCLQAIMLELRDRGHGCVLVCRADAPLLDWARETGLDGVAFDFPRLLPKAPGRSLSAALAYRRLARRLTERFGRGVFYANCRPSFIGLATLPRRYLRIAHHHSVFDRASNRLLYPRMDHNVFVSRFVFEVAGEPTNGSIILNAGALECDLPPIVASRPPDALKLAMFARIAEYKGHALVLGASAGLAKSGVRHEIEIWGTPSNTAEEQFLAELRRKADADGLPVCFKGFHPHPEQIMRSYHAILNPSLNEPFGLVPVEGFSLGVAVISHASGGSLEIYRGAGEYAPYLFGEYDAEGLAAAITALAARASDPEDEAARLDRIRAEVRQRFSIARVGNELETVIAQVLRDRPYWT